MSMIREGSQVAWFGPEVDGFVIGDAGKLLAHASQTHAHVQWMSGEHAGQIEIVGLEDLTATRQAQRDPLADSLEHGGLAVFAVRETYDEQGEAGLLNAMASAGHLTAFGAIAEEVMGQVNARIRQDPSFRAVAAHLDEDEAESLVALATTCLLRDAFTEES